MSSGQNRVNLTDTHTKRNYKKKRKIVLKLPCLHAASTSSSCPSLIACRRETDRPSTVKRAISNNRIFRSLSPPPPPPPKKKKRDDGAGIVVVLLLITCSMSLSQDMYKVRRSPPPPRYSPSQKK